MGITRLRPRRPGGLRVRRAGGVLHLSLAWRSFDEVVVPALGAVLLGLTGGAMLASPGPAERVMGGVLVLAASFLAYVTVRILVNRTAIHVSATALHARSGPLPPGRSAQVHTDQVFQLYLERKKVGRIELARLWVATVVGEHLPLTPTLWNDAAAALEEIEDVLERHLGIDDRQIVCRGCGYDLRQTSGRCPECGRRFRSTKRQRGSARRGRGRAG